MRGVKRAGNMRLKWQELCGKMGVKNKGGKAGNRRPKIMGNVGEQKGRKH